MAKNCLWTKLNAVVDDDSLDVLVTDDYLRIGLSVDDNNNVSLFGSTESPVEVEVLNAVITNVVTGSTLIDNTHALIGNGVNSIGFTVANVSGNYVQVLIKEPNKVQGLYKLTNITGTEAELEKMSNLVYFMENKYPLKIDSIDWSSFTQLRVIALSSSSCTGSITAMSGLPTTVRILSLYNNPGLSGDIRTFGKLINLNNLVVKATGITGTVESFVQSQRTNGRTANSTGISISSNMSQVTFDGDVIPDNENEEKTLTWTADTITITGAKGYNKTVNA